jgi:hypothetical protein
MKMNFDVKPAAAPSASNGSRTVICARYSLNSVLKAATKYR